MTLGESFFDHSYPDQAAIKLFSSSGRVVLERIHSIDTISIPLERQGLMRYVADGGVLFVDEAYGVNPSGIGYGNEAIATLVRKIENKRGNTAVILAGYPDEMEGLLASNSGFKSRVRIMGFDSYNPDQLVAIYCKFAEKESKLSVEREAKTALRQLFQTLHDQKKEREFGNGRTARDVFEMTLEKMSNRLSREYPNGLSTVPDDVLHSISIEDIPLAEEASKVVINPRKMGFVQDK